MGTLKILGWVSLGVLLTVGAALLFVPVIPADQLPRARASATKGNLEALRTAIKNYQEDHQKRNPITLQDLVPTYIVAIPEEKVSSASARKAGLDNSGGWVYMSATGKVALNLQGLDPWGKPFSGY